MQKNYFKQILSWFFFNKYQSITGRHSFVTIFYSIRKCTKSLNIGHSHQRLPSYQAWYHMQWDSKIQLNNSPEYRPPLLSGQISHETVNYYLVITLKRSYFFIAEGWSFKKVTTDVIISPIIYIVSSYYLCNFIWYFQICLFFYCKLLYDELSRY
jgi:hypothetical protein